ncbi:MAG TPA: META domain-containing protein [Acidimicrobiia bacterium]|nr:META domain-containing protein [Acidimicrobiia bacterium]
MRKIIAIGAVALAMTACLGSDFADSVEGSWQLVSGTVDGVEVPVIDTHPITIVFEGDQVSGVAACNSYSGSYSLDGSSIEFGDIAMTEMACVDPPGVMEAEAAFAAGLIGVDTVTIDDGLALSGPSVELVFESTS